ncbi:MAG TPA: hypothetical protein VFY40_01890 [Blastocatellia bacterium]|nr:hypothetical protein [Blastocatellia bacterium]
MLTVIPVFTNASAVGDVIVEVGGAGVGVGVGVALAGVLGLLVIPHPE